MPALKEGDCVRMKLFNKGVREWKKVTVKLRLDERSHDVQTADEASYRRNRAHLNKTVEKPAAAAARLNNGNDDDVPTADTHELQHNAAGRDERDTPPSSTIVKVVAADRPYVTRFGRNVKPPMCYQD